ncbi:MAG: ATP-NAD kinase family protein [Halioglobus sp.]
MRPLRIGLVVNPLAGLGGSLALKGSDGEAVRLLAAQQDPSILSRSMERVQRALAVLVNSGVQCEISSCAGFQGAQVLVGSGLVYELVENGLTETATGADSRCAAQALKEQGADIIVFAGGDGTARDVFDALGSSFPVLGIPAGVKMHSGIFAVSPEAAGELLVELSRGGLVGLALQEVRDIDEEAFRKGSVRSRFYGEMLVPGEGRYLQHTKVGGRESPELVATDIAAWVAEEMLDDCTYLIGPGSTTAAIMDELQLPNTLLGVDVIRDGERLLADATEDGLLDILSKTAGPAKIVLTVIGGQGHVFGRGNQQFSAAVIRAVGRENIIIVAAKSKIAALDERPLLVDTNDTELDRELSGFWPIITGYQDQILYRLSWRAESD